MGVVYRAQDMKLGRQVAVKVLSTGNEATDEAIERFRREARTASSLNHPNICTIYGFDEHEGQCYLAMELLDGEPLDQRLGGRPLDFRTLLDIGAQIADALDAAHSEGILHRDIKPANIFITRRGQVKVLDFGLAKLTSDGRRLGLNDEVLETRAQHFSSVVGTTVGTIAYMSPEQARGEDLDPRTDLFSFGVVLYEMATGRQSFPGHTTAVVFDGILNREPVPASSVNTSMPPDLDRLIAKALEKERTMRYQTAADLRADLQRLRRDSGTRLVAAAQSSSMEQASAQTVMLTASGVATAQPASAAGVSQPYVAPPPPSAVGGFSAPAIPMPPPSTAGAAPAASKTSWIFAGVAVGIALIAVGAGIWVTMRPQAAVVAALPEPTPATEPPPRGAGSCGHRAAHANTTGTSRHRCGCSRERAANRLHGHRKARGDVRPAANQGRCDEDAATSARTTGSLGEGCGSDPAPRHRKSQAGQQPGGSGGCRPAADHAGLPGHHLRRGRGVPGW